jgi:hypothetical protein
MGCLPNRFQTKILLSVIFQTVDVVSVVVGDAGNDSEEVEG